MLLKINIIKEIFKKIKNVRKLLKIKYMMEEFKRIN
jgi:hypothetical protein